MTIVCSLRNNLKKGKYYKKEVQKPKLHSTAILYKQYLILVFRLVTISKWKFSTTYNPSYTSAIFEKLRNVFKSWPNYSKGFLWHNSNKKRPLWKEKNVWPTKGADIGAIKLIFAPFLQKVHMWQNVYQSWYLKRRQCAFFPLYGCPMEISIFSQPITRTVKSIWFFITQVDNRSMLWLVKYE